VSLCVALSVRFNMTPGRKGTGACQWQPGPTWRIGGRTKCLSIGDGVDEGVDVFKARSRSVGEQFRGKPMRSERMWATSSINPLKKVLGGADRRKRIFLDPQTS